jgi:tetratricopeptide (TPR) repeat protein
MIASHIMSGITSVYVGSHDEADRSLQEALAMSHEIGDRRGETEALVYLSLLAHHLGDDAVARTHAQRALTLAREAEDLRNCGHALTHLGHALAGLGHLWQAGEAYEEAVKLRHESGEYHRAVESLAGLARVSLALRKPAEALSYVEEILDYLDVNTVDGTDEPFRVYLTCYGVLKANDDDRAQDILVTARKLFDARVRSIGDPKLRRSFVERVPAHRKLAREW